MGTNYYCETGKKIKKTCDCGFEHEIPEVLHIGKNSFGWCFTLHGTDTLKCFRDWLPVLKRAERIYNEYGEEISFDQMCKIILKASPIRSIKENEEFEKFVAEENARSRPYGCSIKIKNGLAYTSDNTLGEDGNYSVLFGEFC